MKLVPFKGLHEKGITFSRMHIYRLMKAGKFPKSVPVGSSSIAWLESEIDAWIMERVAERDRNAA
ncbi:helix-turn-helix transcriptional regulator [Sinorhizobium meliloti]|uniref:helix-turn-helix transcriptional regulator n=1 Tax=Rhizobium meliloti TaxID=382 RepID=UPI000FDC07D8|nr:AlpA family phage regulatory protein [Sinorhizobium meliloti]RVL05658.1 AlpA family phage regulatory protein [Sinorhizobium meliloti]RVN49962.1 AlpA family phage regulatory protein [Sinorhizobium meliloti]